MLHFIKYNIIGIMNTLITLLVVWILHQLLDWNLELSNFLGFVAGGTANTVNYVVGCVIAFAATAALTFVLGGFGED